MKRLAHLLTVWLIVAATFPLQAMASSGLRHCADLDTAAVHVDGHSHAQAYSTDQSLADFDDVDVHDDPTGHCVSCYAMTGFAGVPGVPVIISRSPARAGPDAAMLPRTPPGLERPPSRALA